MRDTDIFELQALMRSKDWVSVYAMLDDARDRAVNQDDVKREVYWRLMAIEGEERFEAAIEFLRRNANLFNSQSLVHLNLARYLDKLGQTKKALDELKKAPIEEEMESFYGLAIDAKFFYLYLLAKSGDMSVKNRLSEIPDDYRHITMGGKFLTKADIVSFLK